MIKYAENLELESVVKQIDDFKNNYMHSLNLMLD